MEVKFTPLQVTDLVFHDKLPKGNSELNIELSTDLMVPKDLKKQYFLARYNLKITDNNKNFLFEIVLKTRGNYTGSFQDSDTLTKEIEKSLTKVFPQIQSIIRNVTRDFGMEPMDIPLE